MARDFSSKWLRYISGAPRYGTDTTDNIDSVSSVSGIASPPENHTDIEIDSPATWPAYVARLFDVSVAEGGEELARRQIKVEVAFWHTAEAKGWHLITTQPTRRTT